MKNSKEWKGKWVIVTPDNVEIIVHGTLSYSPLNGCVLKVSTDDTSRIASEYIFDTDKFHTINGMDDEKHEYMLLRKCILISGSWTMGLSATFTVGEIIENVYYEGSDSLKFDKTVTEYSALAEWLGINGMTSKFDSTEANLALYKFTYQQPQAIEYDLNDEIILKFFFGYKAGGGSSTTSVFQFSNICYVYVCSKVGEMDINKLDKYSEHFRKILSIFYHNYCFIYGQSYLSNSYEGITFTKYAKQNGLDNSKNHPSGRSPIVEFKDFKDNADKIFKNWFLYGESDDLTYVSWIASKSLSPFSEEVFLENARALEVLHKTKNKKSTFRNSLTVMFSNIKEKCDSDNFARLFSDLSRTIHLIKVNRNYLTHYGDGSIEDEDRLEIEELYRLTLKCKIVLITTILEQIGISPENTFRELCNKYPNLK